MKLRDDHIEALRELSNSTGRASDLTRELEAMGLAINGSGRFGTWAKLTDAGRTILARTRVGGSRAASEQVPAPVQKPGSHSVGSAPHSAVVRAAEASWRGSAPRHGRNAETKRQPICHGVSNSPTAPSESAASGGASSTTAPLRTQPSPSPGKSAASLSLSSSPKRKPRTTRSGRAADAARAAQGTPSRSRSR